MTSQTMVVPEERRIRINGKEYVVRKIGLKQVVKLSAFAAQYGQGVMQRAIEASENGKPDVIAIAEAIGEEELPKLLQILLDAPSLEDRDILKSISVEEASELAEAFTAVNNIKKIIENFRLADANMGGLTKTLGLLSRPSSQK